MDLPKEFKESIASLSEAISQQQNVAAAMMYRLMFRHERNIHILDRYADQVLEGVAWMGSCYAEEDYLNFLQYLQCVLPDEVESHRKLLEFEKAILNDDDFDD